MSKKFGQNVSDEDLIWKLFNQSILMNSNDFGNLNSIYYDMALFLNEIGKNPYNCLKNSAKFDLFSLKKSGAIKKVNISVDPNSCDSCNIMKGKTYTIEEAIDEMPIPNKNCTFRSYGLKNFCRCRYSPIIEWDSL